MIVLKVGGVVLVLFIFVLVGVFVGGVLFDWLLWCGVSVGVVCKMLIIIGLLLVLMMLLVVLMDINWVVIVIMLFVFFV